jgi:uncharacterized repeat protein (TIGR01451 family)
MKRIKASIMVILVVAMLVGLSAGSQQGNIPGQIVIEVLTEDGFQPLDYSIVGTVVPTIRISGPLPEGYRVFNDRPDGRAGIDGGPAELGREITDSFVEIAPGVVEGTLAFLYGANDIIVTDGAESPALITSSQMLNYTLEFEDVNGNGILDTGEDINWDGVLNAGEDLDGNDLLDLDEDLNGNGRLDTDEDLNDNGILDLSEDRNLNGVLDEDVTVTIFALKGQSELSYTPGGFAYEEGILLLDFVVGATDVEISNYLRNWDLRPIGLSLTAAPSGNYMRLTVRIPPDTPGYALARQLNGLEPSDLGLFPEEPPPYPLLLATLNLASEPQDCCGESLPQRLITGRGPNAGDNYPQRICGFDLDGDRVPFDDDHDGRINEDPPGDANGDGAPGILGVDDDGDGFIDEGSVNNDDEDGWIDEDPVNDHPADEVQLFWQHFYMDTFAAHRLVEKLVQPPPHVGVAVVDSGFGNGNDQHLGDVPLARLFGIYNEITDTAFPNLLNLGVQTMLDVIGIFPGGKEHGHGSSVALLAAGDGSQYILGTGKHVNLRPIKTDGTNLADALERAATDPRVDVINVSWGPATNVDTNHNGIVEDIRDENGNGVDDDDPLDDTNGDGHLEPPGKGIDNDGNGKIDDDLPGSELSRAINLMHIHRLNFLNAMNEAYNHQVIIVFAAGNSGHDGVAYTFPGVFSARRRDGGAVDDDGDGLFDEDLFPLSPVAYGDPPAVDFFTGVGATGYDGSPDEGETACAFSNAGPQLSVSAAGETVIGVTPETPYRLMTVDGTSFAAPLVSGLAGELIVLDRGLNPDPKDQYTAEQIVEFIEATADDLGTTGPPPRLGGNDAPNDKPGDGPDDRFGFGRINAWKATLSAVNAGLARESHSVGARGYSTDFPSLPTITEADTEWYGFKVITSVLGATAWIDGKQLLESEPILPNPFPEEGSTQTSSKQINSYAGVRSDRAIMIGVDDDKDSALPHTIRLDEDPTSGIVPVGNDGGEYIMTFSIQKDDLVKDGKLLSLSIRRPGQTAADAPFFNLKLDLEEMRKGKVPGVVFDDFVFEITPADFGDAPASYGTLLKDNGAHHANTNLEWLGKPGRPNHQSVSPEQDADSEVDQDGVPNISGQQPDLDRYDDGVVFFPLTYVPGKKGRLEFTVRVADQDSGRYADDPDRYIYVNGWIDWDTDGHWIPLTDEHVVKWVSINPADDWKVMTGNATLIQTSSNCATFRSEFTVPGDIGSGGLWARFRLDYGENAGWNDPRPLFRINRLLLHTEGPAHFGEVEDYLIGSDFGDAPDPGSGKYPTRRPEPSSGARHLDIYKEWLGGSKTREPDACLEASEASADEDTHHGAPPNLGPNCQRQDEDLAEETAVFFHAVKGELRVTFTVHSTISTRGYDLMGTDDDRDGRIDEDPFADGVDEDGDGEDGEDGPNQIPVISLDPGTCSYKSFLVWSTPLWSGGKGRYHATQVDDDRDGRLDMDLIDGTDNDGDGLVDEDAPIVKPLFVNIYVDWNQDGDWDDASEWVLKDRLIAPETFGANGKYTLGEPFEDRNHDGVWQPGEPFTDSAGVDSQPYTCTFDAPKGTGDYTFIPWMVKKPFWVRIRLSYAETHEQKVPHAIPFNEVGPGTGIYEIPEPWGGRVHGTPSLGIFDSEQLVQLGICHSTEDDRHLNKDRGGALAGEVEDCVIRLPNVTKSVYETFIPLGGELTYTIFLSNPSIYGIPGIVLFDPLPFGVSFSSFIQALQGIAFNPESNALEGQFDLGALEDVQVIYTVDLNPEITGGTTFANCAMIEGPGFIYETCTPVATVCEPPQALARCNHRSRIKCKVPLGEKVYLDGKLSRAPDGQIISYFWDFDDGTTATGLEVEHVYRRQGRYEVCLTVTDDQGVTDTDCVRIEVVKPKPPEPVVNWLGALRR